MSANDTVVLTASPIERPPAGDAGPGYRAELHGLRGVAIAMVVVYHVFFGRVSGGVDVFLMISAFLMTGSFVNRLERGRPVGVGAFWAKAFKRLLPPAVVTILLTVLAVWWLYPAYRWRSVLQEAVASLTYTQNWHLAWSAVDYYAADRSRTSPLRHFWSLSVQGQVFLLWPLLILIGWWLISRRGWAVRPALTGIFGVVFAASFAWSVWSTAHNQTFAYFDTLARLWEFALGSLLALTLPLVERRFGFGPTIRPDDGGLRSLRVAVGWVGIGAMLAVGFMVDVRGVFPGWIALWPLLSACLVISAGRTGSPLACDTVLASRPMKWLGDVSYALYLVHWPLLITLVTVQEEPQPSPLQGLALIAASLVGAHLLTRWVDAPIRYSTWLGERVRRQVGVIAVCLLVGLVPVLGMEAALNWQKARLEAFVSPNNPGAAVLTGASDGPLDPRAPVLPLPQDVEYDWAGLERGCKGAFVPRDAALARECKETESGDPNKVIVVAGNSRSEQMMAALRPLASHYDYRLVSVVLSGCPFGSRGLYAECDEWNAKVLEYLEQIRPVAIFTATTIVWNHESVVPGLDETITRLSELGIDIIGLRDQPRLPEDPAYCMDVQDEEACVFPADEIFGPDELNTDLARHATSWGTFHPVDLTPWICPDGYCVPVIGNVRVYLDQAHITQLYATTLAPGLDEQLRAAGWVW